MNNQTPTETPYCYNCNTSDGSKCTCDPSPFYPAPPAEQTSESYLFGTAEPASNFKPHAAVVTIDQAKEFADLRCKELLEAASKELPEITQEYAKRGVSYERQVAVFGQERADNAWQLYMIGAAEYHDKAAPIIAALKWQLEVQKGLNTSIIEAYEKLGHDALRKENEHLHSRVRELEADGWISTASQLPEHGDLVTMAYDYGDRYCYETDMWSDEHFKYYKLNSITHFKPLTPPPPTHK